MSPARKDDCETVCDIVWLIPATERMDPTYAEREFTCIQSDSEQLPNCAGLCQAIWRCGKKKGLYTSQKSSGPHLF